MNDVKPLGFLGKILRQNTHKMANSMQKVESVQEEIPF